MPFVKKTNTAVEGNLIMYIELDEEFNELKKIELVGQALLGYASQSVEFNGTTLANTPLLSISELNAIDEMSAVVISKEEFYSIWDQVILVE